MFYLGLIGSYVDVVGVLGFVMVALVVWSGSEHGCAGWDFADVPRGLAVVTLVVFDYIAIFEVLLGIQYSI